MPINQTNVLYSLISRIKNFRKYLNNMRNPNIMSDLNNLIIKILDINNSLARTVPVEQFEKIQISKENLLKLTDHTRRNENSKLKIAIITKYYEILQHKNINNQILQIITELSDKDKFIFSEPSTLSQNDRQFFGRR